MRTHTHKQMIT